jgi:predicted RNA binding protein YcfA (HicA-like mRNA interferase family)
MKRLASKGAHMQTVHPWVQRRAMLMVHAGYRKISVLAHKIRGFLNIQKK